MHGIPPAHTTSERSAGWELVGGPSGPPAAHQASGRAIGMAISEHPLDLRTVNRPQVQEVPLNLSQSGCYVTVQSGR